MRKHGCYTLSIIKRYCAATRAGDDYQNFIESNHSGTVSTCHDYPVPQTPPDFSFAPSAIRTSDWNVKSIALSKTTAPIEKAM
jgi:hypothetical protein